MYKHLIRITHTQTHTPTGSAASPQESQCVIIMRIFLSLSLSLLSPPRTQIFVATIAFLLPSAEHSAVEADKKVHCGEWKGA